MTSTELNLTELLKGCEGEMFWSQIWGEVILNRLHPDNNNGHQPLVSIKFPNSKLSRNITADGYLSYGERYGYCILWPSKELYEEYPLDPYSAWMAWKKSRELGYKLAIEFTIEHTEDGIMTQEYDDFSCMFRSEQRAQQAIEIVKKALQKFHEKNNKR